MMPITDSMRDSIVISVATKTTFGGMIASFMGWFTHTGTAVFIGTLVTLLGFGMNYYFQRRKAKREDVMWEQEQRAFIKEEKRKEELHQARLKAFENTYSMGTEHEENY